MATKKKSGTARKSASRKGSSAKKAAASKSKKGGTKKAAAREGIVRPPAPRPTPVPAPLPTPMPVGGGLPVPGGGTLPDPMLGGTQFGPTTQPNCRPKSTLSFVGGVILGAFFEADPMDEGIWVEVVLNPRHAIVPRPIASCPTNPDGVVYLTASSSNICFLTGPLLRTTVPNEGVFDRIQFKVLPCARSQFKLGIRIKYEEDFRVTRMEKPRRKAGVIPIGRPAPGQRVSVPPQSIVEIPDEGN